MPHPLVTAGECVILLMRVGLRESALCKWVRRLNIPLKLAEGECGRGKLFKNEIYPQKGPAVGYIFMPGETRKVPAGTLPAEQTTNYKLRIFIKEYHILLLLFNYILTHTSKLQLMKQFRLEQMLVADFLICVGNKATELKSKA